MAQPSLTTTIVDGGLGNAASPSRENIIVGPSSAGTEDTLTKISSVNQVNTDFGYGPGPLAVQMAIAESGQPVYFCKSGVTTPGSGSTATHTGTGQVYIESDSTPTDRFEFRSTCVKAGGPGTGKLQFSFDGNRTKTGPFTIPSSLSSSLYNSTRGLKFTFENTSFTLGATTAIDVFPPESSTTEVGDAIDAIANDSNCPPDFTLYVAVDPLTSASAISHASALSSKVSTLRTMFKHPTFVVNMSGSISDINNGLLTDNVGFDELNTPGTFVRASIPRVQAGYGNPKVPMGHKYFAVVCNVPLNQSPADRTLGALVGVNNPDIDDFANQSGAASDANIVCTTTGPGSTRLYFNHSRTQNESNSDFDNIVATRVLNRATSIAESVLANYINSNVATKIDGSGQITEGAAQLIEGRVNKQLSANLIDPGYAIGYKFQIDRSNNVESTKTVKSTLKVKIFTIAEQFELTVGLTTTL